MDVIYFSLDKWNATTQRVHHIARSLAENNRVVFVNPGALSILGYLKNHWLGDKTRNFFPKVEMISPQFSLFFGPPLLHFSEYSDWVNRFNYRVLELTLKKFIKEENFVDPVLWLTSPLHTCLLGQFNESVSVYDCMDNHAAFYKKNSARSELARKLEGRLIQEVDIVFCTASSIYERVVDKNPNSYIVRNAVSEKFFANQNELLCPDDMKNLKPPIIGFIGTLSHWVDIEAVIEIAKKRPEWSIVMAGPIVVSLPEEVKKVSNLFFLGPKPYTSVPQYLSKFDVGLIPFKINDLTVDVNPVKLYEYFAFGIPVVSSPLPEVILQKELCYIAETPAAFIEKIEAALAETSSVEKASLVDKRKTIAHENTWQQRSVVMQQTIDKFLESRNAKHLR